jgi:predicted dehydrogenase
MSATQKCGILGYGYMGEIRKRVIDSLDSLELIGIVEPNEKIVEKIEPHLIYSSLDELLNKEIDIIFVATPNSYAPDLCIQSLNAGKHVFCEKPPGKSLEDIESIIEAENANPSVKLMFGFNHRFHPAVMKARAVIDSGRMGNVLGIRGLYGKSGGLNYRNSWRNNKEVSGGGILLDQGIHMLDLFRYFCGDFEYVKCFLDDSFWKMDVEDNAYVILGNQKNQNAFFHSSATLWKHIFRIEIMLEKGYLNVEGLLSKTGSYGRERLTIGKRQFEDEAEAVGNPSEEIIYFDRDLSWELEIREFINCIIENRTVSASSSSDAWKVMKIIEQAYQDALKNKGGEVTQ